MAGLQPALPEHSFRALLHCVDLELFLGALEREDFNPFSNRLAPGALRLGFRMARAARRKRFLVDLGRLN